MTHSTTNSANGIAEKVVEMADCMKRLLKEMAQLQKQNVITVNFEITKTRRDNARESARESAIEIRRLKHEAHCIAVELGIAERRDESYYTPSTAPAGFGREIIFDRRAPSMSKEREL